MPFPSFVFSGIYINPLLCGCVQVHGKAYSLHLLSTSPPKGTQLKAHRLNLFLELHVYSWQNLNWLFIPGLSAGVKNMDFAHYPAAETVN